MSALEDAPLEGLLVLAFVAIYAAVLLWDERAPHYSIAALVVLTFPAWGQMI